MDPGLVAIRRELCGVHPLTIVHAGGCAVVCVGPRRDNHLVHSHLRVHPSVNRNNPAALVI
eukprot:scaffold11584_cov160-Amphora_coffeaeformis.AAC.3